MDKDDRAIIAANHRLAEALERMQAEEDAIRRGPKAPVAAPLSAADETAIRHRIFSDPNSPFTRAAARKREYLGHS